MTGSRARGGPEVTRPRREVGHRRTEAAPRLRWGRLVALGAALGLTAAVLIAAALAPDPTASAAVAQQAALTQAALPGATASTPAAAEPTTEPQAAAEPAPVPPPPADSGSGRRIVFDQSDQRVWLVEDDESITRTYPVSGSRFDNLKPGSYAVQSRQRHATAFDYSGTMEYFVRFATGWSAPIGFHSIPVYNNGELEQSVAELGTPLSAGCVRQKKSDAKFLWDWAPVGTPVVVTA